MPSVARRWPIQIIPIRSGRSCTARIAALCSELHHAGWEVSFEPASEVVHVGGAATRRAFGDTIYARKLAADYDWYQSERGAVQARLWAAANILGCGSKVAVARLILA